MAKLGLLRSVKGHKLRGTESGLEVRIPHVLNLQGSELDTLPSQTRAKNQVVHRLQSLMTI